MRAIWSGSLSFGLINIPVKIYSASKDRALKFKLLDKKDLCPIGYSYICKLNNKEVKYEEIIRGFEYQKGNFVILTDDDFKKANVKKTKSIEIINFLNEEEIDSKYFEKPYYIEPEENAYKAYMLLRDALKESKKVALARFVFKDREKIGVVKAENDLLILDQLRFQDEIRDASDLKVPKEISYTKKEMEMAMSLIDQLSEKIDIAELKDSYTEELERVIEDKIQGKEPSAKGTIPTYTDAADLLKVLKESLAKEKNKK